MGLHVEEKRDVEKRFARDSSTERQRQFCRERSSTLSVISISDSVVAPAGDQPRDRRASVGPTR